VNDDLYQAATEKQCTYYQTILDEARLRLKNGPDTLTELEYQGLVHSLQVLIENGIGKAKHILKRFGLAVLVPAYDAFEKLAERHLVSRAEKANWRRVVGFRNTVVHEYMQVDMDLVRQIVMDGEYSFVTDFLKKLLADFRD
jgi:uncharacterized protein YutE (UPF0331/DUF86 family)